MNCSSKENKNLDEAQYRAKTIENLKKLGKKHGHYDELSNRIHMIEYDDSTFSIEVDDRTKQPATAFEKKITRMKSALEANNQEEGKVPGIHF